jgi:hypothetical protein
VRARGCNIFEVSDEKWVEDEVLLPDPGERSTNPFGNRESDQPARGEGESARGRRRPATRGPAALAAAASPAARRSPALLVACALVAGTLLFAESVLSDHGSERSPRRGETKRTAPRLHRTPPTVASATGKRSSRRGTIRRRQTTTDSSAGAPPSRPVLAPSAPEAAGRVPEIKPVRTGRSAESPQLGQEFSFER